jgi:predicted anti-sigma-YlaC factor YlaD
MNCRAAQRLLSADRDGALDTLERAGLDEHVAACAECRQFRVTLEVAAAELKTAATRVTVPDEDRAWQDIHREIRAGRPVAARSWWAPVRWALPLGAAALFAVVAFVPMDRDDDGPPAAVARAEFVEVPNNSSSVVYVDDKSGWLVVWAAADATGG